LNTKEEFSWRMLFAAFILVLVGMLLMLQSSNMLFEINPLTIFVLGLAVILIFSGIVLTVVAFAA
jgi:uncharacterized membrane protein HdeD (DUF308 family)